MERQRTNSFRIRKGIGRRGWTRTSDHLLRRQVLYPPELRARVSSLLILKYFNVRRALHETVSTPLSIVKAVSKLHPTSFVCLSVHLP
jgi:hypothetical protein